MTVIWSMSEGRAVVVGRVAPGDDPSPHPQTLGQVRAGDPWRDARMILHLVLGAIHDLVLGIASPQARRAGDADAAAEPEARSRQVAEEAAYVWSFCWGGLAGPEAR